MTSFLLVIFCALVVLVVIGIGIFTVLLKLGVIVRAAAQPVHQDHGEYTLEQGREVRPEEQRR